MVMILANFLLCCSYIEERQLNSSREQWRTKNIKHYRYIVKILALNTDGGKPVQIEVKDNKRISLKCLECEIKIPDSFNDLSSIEDLFELIGEGLKDDSRSIDVEYDDEFGYPIEIRSRSNDLFVFDSSSRIEISKFEVIK
jgi:hypothetical protein